MKETLTARFFGDSTTIELLLAQMEASIDHVPAELIYDRGGKGQQQIGNTTIATPGRPLKRDSEYV